MRCITPVRLQVALKAGDEAQSLCFSRTWTTPRTVLHLASGRLALRNVTYLVADDECACGDFLIRLPVLRHLKVDTRTLLETNRASLDGTDCTLTIHSTAPVSWLMIARMNGLADDGTRRESDHRADHPHVNYFAVRTGEDPFPDPSLLDLVDNEQHDTIRAAVTQLS